MPITSNVAWDGRLEAFKGRDASHFVTTTAATARTCASCGLPLQPGEALSLSVDVTEGTAPDGTEHVTFDPWICHRDCQEPGLTVRESAGPIEELTPLGARLTLDHRDETGTRTVPALAFTLFPNMALRGFGGELISALVSVLLTHGFQLSLSADYGDIVEHTTGVKDSCSCTVTEQGFVSFDIDGESIFSRQLDLTDPGDACWMAAAREGTVLVISGDNLNFTEDGIDLDPAARLGTLVSGNVNVRT
ncbi:hypothetical protein [Arthrobacter sp. Bi83]|uniref:hypothetical protein n=1 Tax=Arthrobacter sp. Bi83 TaxID=2822353 RepID=UPI001E32E914|nr:hypothetical protein [Arthrobacter sp. Bi83]